MYFRQTEECRYLMQNLSIASIQEGLDIWNLGKTYHWLQGELGDNEDHVKAIN